MLPHFVQQRSPLTSEQTVVVLAIVLIAAVAVGAAVVFVAYKRKKGERSVGEMLILIFEFVF